MELLMFSFVDCGSSKQNGFQRSLLKDRQMSSKTKTS